MMRKRPSSFGINLPVKLFGAVCLSALAAGCNSQSSRFNEGVFTGVVPAPVGGQNQLAGAPVGGYPAAPGYPPVDPVSTGSVAPPAPINSTVSGSTLAPVPLPSPSEAGSMAAREPVPARQSGGPAGWTTAGGTQVTIGSGETLYNLSRRYGVPANEIMKANGIADASNIKAGQVIVIPQYAYGRNAPISAPDNDPNTRNATAGSVRPASTGTQVASAQVDSAAPVTGTLQPRSASNGTNSNTLQPSSQSNGTPAGSYTVQSGDSLIRISKLTGVSVEAIQQANGLSGTAIRVGQALVIPASGSGADASQTAAVETSAKQSRPSAQQNVATASASTEVAAATPKATGIEKLRWPAKGQVMTGFGATSNGRKSDGIDISVPQGTPVKAAENGVVIYAGSGLKEYGNTVLVRHDNGLVSVYGHASEITVQRGDQVTRGEVVALSGMSGDTSRPKLHFEIRKDAKPVDPMTYLE